MPKIRVVLELEYTPNLSSYPEEVTTLQEAFAFDTAPDGDNVFEVNEGFWEMLFESDSKVKALELIEDE